MGGCRRQAPIYCGTADAVDTARCVPLSPEANFVRDVDYCSAAFLMVRADAVRSMNGFDPRYARPTMKTQTSACACSGLASGSFTTRQFASLT